jgi:acyl carrier protein
MTMRNQVYIAVISAIQSIQNASGRSGSISGNTRPTRDLNGFDSLNAVEASCQFSASLGSDIPGDVNLFINGSGEHRTVDEIVDAVCEILQKQESA